MKIVINKCYGGFSLSMKAVKRLAELRGRKCFFFKYDFKTRKYTPVDQENELMWMAFDIDNPNEVLRDEKDWNEMTDEERKASNKLNEKHSLSSRDEDRADPLLIKVVEELGDKANGRFASLAIVEIPDGVEWEIDEYDGNESIHETHRSWA